MGKICIKCNASSKNNDALYCIYCGEKLPDLSQFKHYSFEYDEIPEIETGLDIQILQEIIPQKTIFI